MSAPMHYRNTVAEINLSHLRFNVAQIQKKIGPRCQIMAVIKANAYGHGDGVIARALEKMKIPLLAVAYLEEGIRLRQHRIKTPIVVLTGGQDPKHFEILHHYRLTPVFYDPDYLTAYNTFCRKQETKGKVHLKFDTGMHRLGFSEAIAPEVLSRLPSLKNLSFEGMMTHLANAERPSHFNHEQIQQFQQLAKASPVKFKYYHVANSGAIFNDFGVNDNLVRPGLALYGAYSSLQLKKKVYLKPVMSLKSQIIQLKEVRRGDYISYGYTHRFKNNTLIATVPIGYADGFLRFYSNKGEVLIRGRRAAIVGAVTMDMLMVDVGHIGEVSLEDEVVLIGRQQKDLITVEELADRIQSIPWEVFCCISDRVPRLLAK